MTSTFITGTDTGVGKTFVTALLLRAWRARGVDAVGFKPLCCGAREDAEVLRTASGNVLTLNEVNPVWLRTPAAPYVAAMIENRQIDLALVREVYAALSARHQVVLVEGVGGWMVPILREYTVADLAADLGLPVLVVVANRLGALNHTALTVQGIRQRGLEFAGIVLNEQAPSTSAADEETGSVARVTNKGVIEEWLGVEIRHEIGWNQTNLLG